MEDEYYRYTIMPDYGFAPYAWLVKPGEGRSSVGCCTADAHGWRGHIPISDSLQADFSAWAIQFENEARSDSEENVGFDWTLFHCRGVELAKRLKNEVGSGSKVFYIKPHEDPGRELECCREVMLDGTLREFSPISDVVLDYLSRIEKEHHVRILYAVESGSRAWGFASRNSDFDVRFLYIHKPDWYLSIREKRDVIEIPIDDELDISGWDLRKALGLLRKTNPPLLEWLGSPVVYLDRYGLAEKMRRFVAGNFSPRRCLLHYFNMAKGNFKEYLKAETVRVKKYFYVLRPVLGCLWIERHNSIPPTEFGKLYQDADLPPSLKREIDNLLQRKIAGGELDMESRIEVINEFMEGQIEHFSSIANDLESPESDVEALDDLFREMLHVAWKKE